MKSLFPDNWNKSREVEVHTRLVAQKSCGLNLLFLVITVPESSSSSQGISLKRWAVLAENDAASDSRCRPACLFQASGLLLYFDKSIRSTVLHFQFTLTQIYCLIVALQTEFLLQRFSQNSVYLWLHWNSHAYVWAVNHISQFIFYLFKSCLPLVF